MRSKNPFLSFRTLSGVPKQRSDPNTHSGGDCLPAEALCAKREDPLHINDPLGTAQLFALGPGIPQAGFYPLDDQAALQFRDPESHS